MNELYLTLADGSRWSGRGALPRGAVEGEVVFTTSSCGYPQSITDPSYNGQILVFAFPPEGIYGVDDDALESPRPWLRGVIIHNCEKSPLTLSRQLEEWLESYEVPLVTGIDCRSLILHLRSHGAVMGRLSSSSEAPVTSGLTENLVHQVSSREIISQGEGNIRVGVIDYGVKEGIIKSLLRRGCQIVRFPHDIDADTVISYDLNGVVLSNGPGDPSVLNGEIATIQNLSGRLPLFGVCLGTQLLARACGAVTKKLPFGHRGANQPVQDLRSGRGYLTSQNHGYAILENTLADASLEVTFRHLGDGTIEGVRHKKLSIEGVQFHPEASPGPCDTSFLFDNFIGAIA